ncbi:MAG TPA: DUF2325 domain-containing protein [Aliidongia sp.]|uniref:DUF2325 domain-containing protein n=1 Tax=Aliidongia sp. TaxID=1914230 RepID=UPI002DDDBCE3|nr:DUF2325 domain-containing protein [Aliidongia sp.]HEV2676119.1 DUF2325 domain-containing protein [Aliidongia sp.]
MGSSGPLLLDRPPFPGRLSDLPFRRPISDAALTEMLEAPARKRSRLWELSATLHCSIIGTCLSTAELRQILAKVRGSDLRELTEHEIHGEGVRLAGRHDGAGKLLHKALDKRHQATLNRFAKAETSAAVEALWDEAKRAGEIPGAYWAALSHPASTDVLVKAVFADVHMLSHLVGAANRADIRRLTALEVENAALAQKLQKSQAHLQTADATIRQLDAALAAAVARAGGVEPATDDAGDAERVALRRLVGELEARLQTESARRLRAEDRAQQARRAQAEAEAAAQEAQAGSAHLAAELAVFERQAPDDRGEETAPELPAGLSTLLYVGGRPNQVHRLREFTQQAGIELLHHDGGIEDRTGLLAGLVSRADAACFPVDCVSHDAVATVKRLCRHAGKSYLPLRSNGLGSLVVGLAKLAASTQPAGAD